MERAVYTSKSFIIALALVQRHISVEEAALASHVEVNSQIDKWGEVEDCKSCTFTDVASELTVHRTQLTMLITTTSEDSSEAQRACCPSNSPTPISDRPGLTFITRDLSNLMLTSRYVTVGNLRILAYVYNVPSISRILP